MSHFPALLVPLPCEKTAAQQAKGALRNDSAQKEKKKKKIRAWISEVVKKFGPLERKFKRDTF